MAQASSTQEVGGSEMASIQKLAVVLMMMLSWAPAIRAAGEWEQRFDAGLAAYTEGDFDAARAHWTAAMEEARTGGSLHELTQTLDWLAKLEELSGKSDQAESHLRERARLLQSATGVDRLSYLTARASLARFLDREGKHDQAHALLEENVVLYREVGRGFLLADPHLDLARHYEARGDLASSASQYESALSVLGEEITTTRVQALEEYAQVLERLGRSVESSAAREQSSQVAQQLKAVVEKNREQFLR